MIPPAHYLNPEVAGVSIVFYTLLVVSKLGWMKGKSLK